MEAKLRILERDWIVAGEETDSYFKTWRDLGRYDSPAHIRPFREILKPDWVCIDVGANIGLTTIIMGTLASRVYCFEPSATNYRHLCRTIEANGLTQCVPIRRALGAKAGSVSFGEFGPHSHVRPDGEGTTVPVQRLDDWTQESDIAKVDFIKIDVEGYEQDVLRGAERTIAGHRPCALIEFNSLTTIMVGRITPFVLIDELCDLFPHIEIVDRHSGARRLLDRSRSGRENFVGVNLTTGFLDDLLCHF